MVNNKKAWIRLVEAVAAVIILAGVLLVAYTANQGEKQDVGEYVHNIQVKILTDIANNDELRRDVLTNDLNSIQSFANLNTPTNFNSTIVICNITLDPCRIALPDKNVFVEERIIVADLEIYNPRKVRIYTWEL